MAGAVSVFHIACFACCVQVTHSAMHQDQISKVVAHRDPLHQHFALSLHFDDHLDDHDATIRHHLDMYQIHPSIF
jgi:hypothetical protein